MLVKTLAENTQNFEKRSVNWNTREFATFFQLPEAVSTRFMFCRAGNLAGQSVTSFARHHPLALECLFRRQTRTEARREGTPRSAQAGPLLPVAARLRQVREAGGARTLPRRQPAQGDAGVAAVGKGVNGPPRRDIMSAVARRRDFVPVPI